MSSYLEAYGAAEAKHARTARIVKLTAMVTAAVLIVGLLLYAFFKDYSEEQRVKSFVALLQSRNYQEAYRFFGCSEAQPCPNYRFDKFMDDWGPKSEHADALSAHLGEVQSCGDGVLVQIAYKGSDLVPLYVDRNTKVVSFAPWPECPGRHWRIGAALKSLFGR